MFTHLFHHTFSRTRWSAFGAAVAVTVAAGVAIPGAGATVSTGTRAIFVPVVPCRLFDTRPAPLQVGSRGTPIGATEVVGEPVVGTNGNCTVPADAIAVAMNVTAVNATGNSFLTIWPADADQPLASNLNYSPGAPPTPNKVDVKLSADGAIKLFNNSGTVDVIADVVGYYADHNFDDRYYTKPQIDATITGVNANVTALAADVANIPPPPSLGNAGFTATATDADPSVILGQRNSIAIGVDGFAVISSVGGSANHLRVTHCLNTACTQASVVDTGEIGGTSRPIVIGADGLPIIAYDGGGKLAVVHCSDVGCTSHVTHIVDDPANTVAGFPAMAIGADGLPIIVHRDVTAAAVRVSHCSDIPCTVAVSTTVDDVVDVLAFITSIAIGTDGLAIIADEDNTARALRITHCNNVTCTTASSSTVDDPADLVGGTPAITIGTDGLPIVAHRNATASALRISHCVDVACTTAVSTNVDNPPSTPVGGQPSIRVGIDGMVVVAHSNGSTLSVRLTHCSDVACTSATSIDAYDVADQVATDPTMTIGVDGMPIFAVHDANTHDQIVVHCSNVFCIPYYRR